MGNALFSSSATVHLNSNRSVVAVTYELEHNGIHLDHAVTVLEDYRYHSCFPQMDHHYVHLSHELRQKLRRIERLPVIFNDRHRGYYCVRHISKASNAPNAQTVRTSPIIKTPIPSIRSNDVHPSVITVSSHPTPLPRHSPATRPPLQKKNDTHSITTGLFLSNETLYVSSELPHPAPVNASVANASAVNRSALNASAASDTKGSLRSPLVSVFQLTQSSSSHRIDGWDASFDHRHRILLVEPEYRVPVVEPEYRVPVKESHEAHEDDEDDDDEDDDE